MKTLESFTFRGPGRQKAEPPEGADAPKASAVRLITGVACQAIETERGDYHYRRFRTDLLDRDKRCIVVSENEISAIN